MFRASTAALALLATWLTLVAASNTHYYKPDLHSKRAPRRVHNLPKTLQKRVSNGYGLLDNSQTAYLNNIALGWLPNFEVQGAVKAINDALDLPLSIIGDYVQIYSNEDQANPPLVQVDYHLVNVSNPTAQPVYAMALMPQDGFAAVTPAVINAIVNKCKGLNDQGITVWLRYAYEMNLGPGFNAWSGQPAAFIESWQSLTEAIRAGTTDTYMLWSPNVDVNATPNYATYYPGASYVDLYGISLYSFAASARTLNNALQGNEFSSTFQSFYNLYGSAGPIVISETSKPYNYVQGEYPQSPQPGTAVGQEAQTKVDWYTQLTSPATKAAYPSIIAVNWFEFLKDESGVTADFRSLTGMSRVRNAVATYLNN